MAERATKLSETPCYNCGIQERCYAWADEHDHRLKIIDGVFCIKNYDYHNCPNYIALTAPEMVEVDE